MLQKSIRLLMALIVLAFLTACGGGGGSTTASVAVDNCPAALNTTYRYIGMDQAGAGYGTISTNWASPASTGTAIFAPSSGGAGTSTVTFSTSTPCQFTATQDITGGTQIIKGAVSSGSVIAYQSNGVTGINYPFIGIAFPEQTSLTLADFAGEWNGFYTGKNGGSTFQNAFTSASFDSAGAITNIKDCVGTAACTISSVPTASIAKNGTAGFTITRGGASSIAFAYKSSNGSVMIVSPQGDGWLILLPQVAVTLPDVGTLSSWSAALFDSTGTTTTFGLGSTSVTSVDTSTNCYVAQGSSSSSVQTRCINSPRVGMVRLSPLLPTNTSNTFYVQGVSKAGFGVNARTSGSSANFMNIFVK